VQPKRVGILIFPDVEVLDFCGPYEVFSLTRMADPGSRDETGPFEVLLVGQALGPLTAVGGMRVLPDVSCAECPPLDILVVPGGWGTRALMQDAALLDWLKTRAAQAELTASVCTGSLLLAQAGLLDDRSATTHWQALDRLAAFPAVSIVRGQHVVDDGNVVTSAGISAGIDMALGVVARYCGPDVAQATAKYMEYRWTDDNVRRV
jgi:transcriptional regulator GlxA family with amidase domain